LAIATIEASVSDSWEASAMIGTKDILAILEKVPLWRRLNELPAKIEELERRIALLEKRPELPICEACGIGHKRLSSVSEPSGHFAAFAGSGMQVERYKCDNCGFETQKNSG
jgi:hypothetical protein